MVIVKVQQSLNVHGMCLVYDKDHKLEYQGLVTKDIARVLNGRPKAYFEAIINDDGFMELKNEVPEQSW